MSQQGQNQVSMDAQTCLACKSNWCTTWPQEVNTHVHGRLMAEYPTPRSGASEKDHPCQSVRAAAGEKTTLPMRGYIHSSLSEFQSPGEVVKPHCMAMNRI